MRRCTTAHLPLAAAGAALIITAAGAARADVTVTGVDASYYHFGAAFLNGAPEAVLQSAPPAPPLTYDDGRVAFSVASRTVAVTTPIRGGVQVELRTTHDLSASVSAAAPTGMAQVGAGTFIVFVDLIVEAEGLIYTGDLPLVDFSGETDFYSGSEIPPGVYTFAVSRWKLFAVDAQLFAISGQTSTLEAPGHSPVLRFARHIACPADWNADGAVNSNDISAFVAAWLASVGGGGLLADFDANGEVDSQDMTAFISAWMSAVHDGC